MDMQKYIEILKKVIEEEEKIIDETIDNEQVKFLLKSNMKFILLDFTIEVNHIRLKEIIDK